MYNYTSTGFIDSCIEHYFSSAKAKKISHSQHCEHNMGSHHFLVLVKH